MKHRFYLSVFCFRYNLAKAKTIFTNAVYVLTYLWTFPQQFILVYVQYNSASMPQIRISTLFSRHNSLYFHYYYHSCFFKNNTNNDRIDDVAPHKIA